MGNDRGKEWYEREASYDEWAEWWREEGRSLYDSVRPDVTIDCVILTYDDDESTQAEDSLKFLSVRRKSHPWRGHLSLPGTFLHADERSAGQAVRRELAWLFVRPEEVEARIQQIRTFTGIERDPRGQTASILYVVYASEAMSLELNDGVDAVWAPLAGYSVEALDELGGAVAAAPDSAPAGDVVDAFDHARMLSLVVDRLRDQFAWTPNVFYTLPEEFTLTDAMRLRSSLFDEDYHEMKRANFRKKYAVLWDEVGVVDPSDPRSPKLFSVAGKRGLAME
ncbi:NUDIX hydrolase [Bifidobacterium sp. 64T4]|uniref:NUDIX domain-containing protein n=1 Tax=Bifidobacterium pongonis TaxID=2834432 RepID=UPI001C55FADE|nr:NUDIX domain-containing protein [Bifidobacterium pongonis]MBW3094864.1 NUDIX hydrolase [Bifidobacterium pongonis]